jgi:hypothetical protein
MHIAYIFTYSCKNYQQMGALKMTTETLQKHGKIYCHPSAEENLYCQ